MSSLGDWLRRVNDYQRVVREPVADSKRESPAAALESLEHAVALAPSSYSDYLTEALGCYERHLYRAAVLMVWSATMSRLYDAVAQHPGGLSELEAANKASYGSTKGYRKIRRRTDFDYLRDRTFIELAEKAGLLGRSTREMLLERLSLRNRCAHPTGYSVGREEAVIFIESLCLNILSGSMLHWGP